MNKKEKNHKLPSTDEVRGHESRDVVLIIDGHKETARNYLLKRERIIKKMQIP